LCRVDGHVLRLQGGVLSHRCSYNSDIRTVGSRVYVQAPLCSIECQIFVLAATLLLLSWQLRLAVRARAQCASIHRSSYCVGRLLVDGTVREGSDTFLRSSACSSVRRHGSLPGPLCSPHHYTGTQPSVLSVYCGREAQPGVYIYMFCLQHGRTAGMPLNVRLRQIRTITCVSLPCVVAFLLRACAVLAAGIGVTRRKCEIPYIVALSSHSPQFIFVHLRKSQSCDNAPPPPPHTHTHTHTSHTSTTRTHPPYSPSS
jgi:hypothetical protein